MHRVVFHESVAAVHTEDDLLAVPPTDDEILALLR
jgi:hypothetical protein